MFVGSADGYVVESAHVAQRDCAVGVDLVLADTEVGVWGGIAGWSGLDAGAVGL